MRMHWRRQMFTVVLLVGIIMVAGGASGGLPAYIPAQVRGAAAVGIDALFIETHPEPEMALSDGSNMVPLANMRAILEMALAVHSTHRLAVS